MNKAIKEIREYEKDGYQYELMDIEESQYTDKDSGESGDRVVIQVALKRIQRVAPPGGASGNRKGRK